LPCLQRGRCAGTDAYSSLPSRVRACSQGSVDGSGLIGCCPLGVWLLLLLLLQVFLTEKKPHAGFLMSHKWQWAIIQRLQQVMHLRDAAAADKPRADAGGAAQEVQAWASSKLAPQDSGLRSRRPDAAVSDAAAVHDQGAY
jgi:hypothetical protein